MEISTLVISGGGIAGFALYGALKSTNVRGIWKHENIKSIYAVSAGSALAVLLALKCDWQMLDNYFVNRPWNQIFRLSDVNFMTAFYEFGILDKTPIVTFMTPLFAAEDVSMDVTMAEFYERTGIDLHIFAVELYGFEYVDMSHTTHPDLRVIDAIYRSSTLPLIFKPEREVAVLPSNITPPNTGAVEKLYLDGGLLGNYPSSAATTAVVAAGGSAESILGFRFTGSQNGKVTNVLEMFQTLLLKILEFLNKSSVDLPRQIAFKFDNISFDKVWKILMSAEARAEMISMGEAAGEAVCEAAGEEFEK